MNILLITQEDFLAGSTYSVSYLAKGLAKRGHQVYVAARADSLLERLLAGSEATFVPMKLRSRFSLSSLNELVTLVREKDIHVINAQSSKDRYLAILSRWFYGVRSVVLHTRRQTPRSDGGWVQKMIYIGGTDKIIVISEGLKEIFIRRGYPERHLHVIHNGIPADKYQQWCSQKVEALRDKLGLQPDDIVIGCVSRLKKQEQIIRCLPLLERSNVKLVLVGVRAGYFDSLVEKLNIKTPIIYIEAADGSEVLNYYKLFHVNILASTLDGFGLVLLESMAMECPVIATNFGGIKDIVKDGWNGLLFEDNAIAQLAERINLLLTDQELRKTFIANGLNTVYQRFSMENTLNGYEQFYSAMYHSKVRQATWIPEHQ